MVRNDEFFLRRWVSYYGEQLGKENLYVILDGTDQVLESNYEGVHISFYDHVVGQVAEADRGRIKILSDYAADLLQSYDLVIGTDVDEFLVVDPALGFSLGEYLSRQKIKTSLSGLGIDVGQHLKCEAAIDENRLFLQQRRYALLSSRYTKASVLARPVAWGSGFHRVRHSNFHIAKDLFLFHFGCVDYYRIRARLEDKERIDTGWSGHLARRMRTIAIVSHSDARMWNQTVKQARCMQTIFRQIQAWNKPSMLWQKYVVEIPERFRNIV